jgi:NAD(P)-dependent dehydrogenase (short-subunit alcohol dehydrogenase family)
MHVSLVTGCSTGIGSATALELARKGHQVYASMRNLDRSADLARAAADEDLNVHPVELDVDDDASVRDGVSDVLRRTRRIDALVNNAGIDRGGALEETSLDTLREVMETNYFGAMRCTKAVLPHMRERRSGCIVNVSSIVGRVAPAGSVAYCASKFALEAASEALAGEVARFGIRVAIIEPGTIRTPIFEKMNVPPERSPYAVMHRQNLLMFPVLLERATAPEEVAKAIDHAIHTEDPKLRYLVGWDAEIFAGRRSAMSDETYLTLSRIDGDETYFEQFERHWGIDIRPSSREP